MILVDTSVWLDHFRRGGPMLTRRLADGEVLIRPWSAFAFGEFAPA